MPKPKKKPTKKVPPKATIRSLIKAGKKKPALAVRGPKPATFFWNVKKYPQVLQDIVMAKTVYDVHTKKGFKPFHLDAKGNKGEPMPEFEACAGAMLFEPKREKTRYSRISGIDED
jgi:hypothetical protein